MIYLQQTKIFPKNTRIKFTFQRHFKQLLINYVYNNGFKKLVVPKKKTLKIILK